MSILRLLIISVTISMGPGISDQASAQDNITFVKEVLAAFVSWKDHIEVLRNARDHNADYPSLVAALTDYNVFGHGMLVELLFDEGGELLVPALEKKLRTELDCFGEYTSICQPTLADRNSLILGSLWHLEKPK